MRWGFMIPGQPPSVNSMYIKARGRVIKDPNVAAYQLGVTYLVKQARPSGWKPPEGQIRLYYRFTLKRDADCDNLLKALNDAIAMALGIDDRVFLPCVEFKIVDKRLNPGVRVEVDDQS